MLRGRALRRAAFGLVLVLWAAPAVADNTIGAACPAVAGDSAQNANGNNTWCNGSTWQYPAYQLGSTTSGCTSAMAGAMQWTGSAFEVCNGSSWAAIPNSVANANGDTMVSTWPDAISCNVTSPSLGTTIFYAAQMPYSGDSLYHYRYSSGGTNYDVEFTSAQAFSAYANLTTTNCNASISTLYTNGQAFNFVNGTAQAAYNPTYPAGSGFFVLSKSTFTGNLGGGGRAGVDATCLTELTTNTGWKGYATANANGQLVSSKVHAFIDVGNNDITLSPLTTYYFANAGNSIAGGASFTTDANGDGPNDSAMWSAANYFGGDYTYWTDAGGGTNTAWGITGAWSGGEDCNTNQPWDTGTSAQNGALGESAYTTSGRWELFSGVACNNTEHLICYVSP